MLQGWPVIFWPGLAVGHSRKYGPPSRQVRDEKQQLTKAAFRERREGRRMALVTSAPVLQSRTLLGWMLSGTQLM